MYSENKNVELLPPTKKDFQLGSHDPYSETSFSKDRYTIKTCRIKIHHEIYGYDEGNIGEDISTMVSHHLVNPHKWTSEHLAVKITFPKFKILNIKGVSDSLISLIFERSCKYFTFTSLSNFEK